MHLPLMLWITVIDNLASLIIKIQQRKIDILISFLENILFCYNVYFNIA